MKNSTVFVISRLYLKRFKTSKDDDIINEVLSNSVSSNAILNQSKFSKLIYLFIFNEKRFPIEMPLILVSRLLENSQSSMK